MPALPPPLEQRFRAPRHAGSLGGAARRGSGENAACGDQLELELADGRIARAAFRARGCSGVIAVADLLCERAVGLTPAQAVALDLASVVDQLGGLPPTRRHALDVCRRALEHACARS